MILDIFNRKERLFYAVTGMRGWETVQCLITLSATDLLILLMMKNICPIYLDKDSQWIIFAVRMD